MDGIVVEMRCNEVKKEKLAFAIWILECVIWLIIDFLRPDLLPDDKYYMGVISCMLNWIPVICAVKTWKIERIPYCRTDFYGIRRYFFSIFNEKMKEIGK